MSGCRVKRVICKTRTGTLAHSADPDQTPQSLSRTIFPVNTQRQCTHQCCQRFDLRMQPYVIIWHCTVALIRKYATMISQESTDHFKIKDMLGAYRQGMSRSACASGIFWHDSEFQIEPMKPSLYGHRRGRSACASSHMWTPTTQISCASAQSDQGVWCPLKKSLSIVAHTYTYRDRKGSCWVKISADDILNMFSYFS